MSARDQPGVKVVVRQWLSEGVQGLICDPDGCSAQRSRVPAAFFKFSKSANFRFRCLSPMSLARVTNLKTAISPLSVGRFVFWMRAQGTTVTN